METRERRGAVALTGGRIVLSHEIVDGAALLVEGGHVAAITSPAELGDVQRVDVGGRLIAPGLVDIHLHGARLSAFAGADEASFTTVCEAAAAAGVTSLLATFSTAPVEELVDGLRMTREWMASQRPGAEVLGAHLEGPYFNPAQCGAQSVAAMRTPDDGSVDALLQFPGVLRMLTLAPELPGAQALIRRLCELDIVPAAGHSDARDSDVSAAIRSGLRHVVHLWSGQSSTVREGPWRRPGILEASLVSDALTGEVIADGKHLPTTLLRLAWRSKGPERLCVVSDATSGAGLPDGTPLGGGHEVVDGVAMTEDRTSFAGSTTLVNRMVRVLRDDVGVPLVEAVRMASLTPARVIGVDGRKGSLAPGKDADVAIFDDDLEVWATMVGGRWVHGKPICSTLAATQ